MTNLLCLSEQAIRVMKEPGVKGEIMYVLEINDTRTIDKHIKNNFPNSPLMNFHIREIIKEHAPLLTDKEIYQKLTPNDLEKIRNRRKELQALNAKYNNLNDPYK